MAETRQGFTGMRQFRLFSLFGFEVKLDISWLLLALLISWSLGAGMYPAEFPGLARSTYAWMGIAGAAGVFFSIVFHEFSHSLVARQFGMPIRGITLFIFGGVAEMEEEPPSPKAEFLMAVAGPIASFVLAFIFFRMQAVALAGGWPTPVAGVTGSLGYINMVVAIFNLVPAFPLDGGRMLRAGLWHMKKDLRAATRISSQMGSAFGIVLIVLGVIAFLQGNIIGGMWWFLIGIFLRSIAAGSYRKLLMHEILQDKPVRQFMRRNPVTVPPSITLQAFVEDYLYPHHFKMFPVVEDGNLLGVIALDDVKAVPKEEWQRRHVLDHMQSPGTSNSVAADMPAEKLLSAMIMPGRPSRFVVIEDGRLAGVISLKDVMELIALKLEIDTRDQ